MINFFNEEEIIKAKKRLICTLLINSNTGYTIIEINTASKNGTTIELARLSPPIIITKLAIATRLYLKFIPLYI